MQLEDRVYFEMVRERGVDGLFDIDNEQIDNIRKQIGEDEERLEHTETLLQQWVKCQGHLPDDYDRKMTRNFIRGAKFNLDTAKRKLEGYFLAKHAFPEFYSGRNPTSADVVKAFSAVNIVRLPKLTENNERICVMSLASPDPADLDMIAVLKLFLMLYDLTLTCAAPVTTEIFIFDCTHFSSAHFAKFVGAPFKHVITILRDAYAARVSQMHIINCPSMVEKVITILKPLIPEKVRKRMFLHKGGDCLHQHLHPKLLPSDLGGTLESSRNYMRRWQDIVSENSDWFDEQESVKLAGPPPTRIEKFTDDVTLEGSFRQLTID